MCFNRLLVSGESSFSAHDAFDSEECSTVYEQPSFCDLLVFLGCSHCHQKFFIDTLILSRLSGPHELIDGSST